MDLFPIRAVQTPWQRDEFHHKKKKFAQEKGVPRSVPPKKSRVLDVVLERISNPLHPSKSSLFATASAPQILLELLSDFPLPNKNQKTRERKFIQSPAHDLDPRPIGIARCEYNRWINALMQFIIFIPSLSEMFAFTPKSLSSFIEFIDQYRKDRLQNKAVTSANSVKLLESLRKKIQLGFFLKKDPVELFFEILKFLMQTIVAGHGLNPEIKETDLLALHPDWILVLEEKASPLSWEARIEDHFKQFGFFEKADKDLFLPFPKELLICIRKNPDSESNPEISSEKFLPKKQFLLSYLGTPCALYELDAFVEYRPDDSEKGDYLTYVKAAGDWLQCDDQRVILLRPINLPIPLSRSFLFHYKKNK